MLKALIADDTKNIRNLLTTCLEIEGYEVIQACDGLQAFEILKKTNVDLIFLDIKMPQLSGTEVLRRIRELGDNTPVIIMTAFATVKNAIECTKMGAVAYLQKPFTVEKIKMLLSEINSKKENVIQKKEVTESILHIESFIENNHFDEAIKLLKKTIALETTNPKIYYLLSKAYEGIGDIENSQKFFYAYKMFS